MRLARLAIGVPNPSFDDAVADGCIVFGESSGTINNQSIVYLDVSNRQMSQDTPIAFERDGVRYRGYTAFTSQDLKYGDTLRARIEQAEFYSTRGGTYPRTVLFVVRTVLLSSL